MPPLRAGREVRDCGEKKGLVMDKDRLNGTRKQVSGSIHEGVGKVSGDIQTQAEDTAEKVAGKAQNALGTAKDSLRDTVQD